jgi:hypothetical protein
MDIDFTDYMELDSISWGVPQNPEFVTSKLVMMQEVFKNMDRMLADLLEASHEDRACQASMMRHEFSNNTLYKNDPTLALAGKEFLVTDTHRLLDNIEWVRHFQPCISEMLKVPHSQRMAVLWNLAFEPASFSVPNQSNSSLIEEVKIYRDEIKKIVEIARTILQPSFELSECASVVAPGGTYHVDSANLVPIPDGISGSYFLFDSSGNTTFVIKPVDEDISCLNNPKGFGFDQFHNMFNTQLYRSVFRENAVCLLAGEIGVSSIAPKTTLAIIESDQFYDVADKDPLLGPVTKEKLCSCMEFVQNSKSLFEANQDLQWLGLSDEEIANRYDQTDYEETNILLWATGERDGHGGNILVYPKGTDSIGNEVFGLKKIDNGLSLPEEDTPFLRNSLTYMPNAKRPLSANAIEKILKMDTVAIAKILQSNYLDGSVHATTQRIERLKEIVTNEPTLTIKEIHQKLCTQNWT